MQQPLPSSAELSPEELATVKLFQENTASVVNITSIVQAQNPFNMDVMKIPQGQGSGFIWDTKGHIVRFLIFIFLFNTCCQKLKNKKQT